ncbi:MAG TPA: hypothetical protein VEA15_01520 [Caulobacteraceae bacterium]|nr:hypothetical protein [Caulobacteraceae bacterium]
MRGIVLGLAVAATPAAAEPVAITARDGYVLHGQVDRPAGETDGPKVVVLMVPGTGQFDRDVRFGRSGTEADKLFKDLSARITARGVSTLRYDLRGVGYGGRPSDRAVLVARTTDSMRDDVADLYAWARSRDGLGARCAILFGHSEGMVHIGRVADAGAPEPLAVVGMGALLESPQSVMRWQLVGRNVDAVRAMDADRDGRTSNEEVRVGFATSIGAAMLPVGAFIHPNGGWGASEIAAYEAAAATGYEAMRTAFLAKAPTDPYPEAASGWSSYQWWNSWFTDDRPVAARLARWRVPVRIHYGDRDSQTDAKRQVAAGRAALGERFTWTIHEGAGHGLGDHITVGPMKPEIAHAIAADVAEAATACR